MQRGRKANGKDVFKSVNPRMNQIVSSSHVDNLLVSMPHPISHDEAHTNVCDNHVKTFLLLKNNLNPDGLCGDAE